jgi:hypothetical protein
MSWKAQSACLGQDTNIFFEVYEDNAGVRGVVDKACLDCPVNRRCFAEGVSKEEYGVWGGIYLEEGVISPGYNEHKSPDEWNNIWTALTMEQEHVH